MTRHFQHPQRRLVNPYITDPASSASTRLPVLEHNVFDTARVRAAARRGLIDAIPSELSHPNDALLISTMVAHGHPRWSAEQMPGHPGLRFAYFRFWIDVQNAARGDAEAKERVDACRAAWAQMRRDDLISDTPEHVSDAIKQQMSREQLRERGL